MGIKKPEFPAAALTRPDLAVDDLDPSALLPPPSLSLSLALSPFVSAAAAAAFDREWRRLAPFAAFLLARLVSQVAARSAEGRAPSPSTDDRWRGWSVVGDGWLQAECKFERRTSNKITRMVPSFKDSHNVLKVWSESRCASVNLP